ncbi:Peptidase S66, LD-carboxypeptidase A [Candidatus Magnetobacterium bavaricum]|uniref:Peptidase S66, LD-carboxypeptidase A n=1 Tax=Candidatus Magnetobacterium bavaricum TaxID=29290 RepID=A0A0F3GZ08_9BACT|nr:Peptidase S66, LD-carboxypeptidase A [Candidatus Magnetobacterium bavaricum]
MFISLQPGDIIGIVSPSDPLVYCDGLGRGIDYLQRLGFRTELGRHIGSSVPQQRAEDINGFFARGDVRAIFSTQGGNSAELVLPHCDMDMIAANPKIFMGLSDVTVFLNAIHHRTGLVTYHGNNVRLGVNAEPGDYDREELIDRLCRGKTGDIRPYRQRTTIRGGVGRGRLLGGNLRCLLKLVDTEFWPDFTDSILFIESYRITPESCLRYFEVLRQRGVFEGLRGCLVGFNYSMQVTHPQMPQMARLLLEFTDACDFPILKVEDFGHFCPNTVLPVGSVVEFDADTGRVTI